MGTSGLILLGVLGYLLFAQNAGAQASNAGTMRTVRPTKGAAGITKVSSTKKPLTEAQKKKIRLQRRTM